MLSTLFVWLVLDCLSKYVYLYDLYWTAYPSMFICMTCIGLLIQVCLSVWLVLDCLSKYVYLYDLYWTAYPSMFICMACIGLLIQVCLSVWLVLDCLSKYNLRSFHNIYKSKAAAKFIHGFLKFPMAQWLRWVSQGHKLHCLWSEVHGFETWLSQTSGA